MAIVRTIITDRGVIYENQYCRVDKVEIINKSNMQYTIGVYFNKDATSNFPHRAEIFESQFDLYNELNVWQQAYADIKGRWPDAIDT